MQAFAQDVLISKKISISFFSEARLENIQATSEKGSSVLKLSTNEIGFKVPISSFKFRNGLMEEHFNENYMESSKFPTATFKGKLVEKIDFTAAGTYKVSVRGVLTMHGISKEREFKGILVVNQDNITIVSDFVVPVSDHNIDIPNDKLSNISQEIKVSVNALYQNK